MKVKVKKKKNLPKQTKKEEKELTLIDWWITLKEKPLTVSVFNEEKGSKNYSVNICCSRRIKILNM